MILKKELYVSGDFNINEFLFDKADRPSNVFNKALAEIKADKFQFFLGLKDQNSIVSTIPKELVNIMLSDIEYPSIKKRAEEMLANAIKEKNRAKK